MNSVIWTINTLPSLFISYLLQTAEQTKLLGKKGQKESDAKPSLFLQSIVTHAFWLIHITEVGILLVREILESMHHVLVAGLVDARGCQGVALFVLVSEVEA